jgi:uncharacterized protein YdhG (YjbR/CyaY superfamily)
MKARTIDEFLAGVDSEKRAALEKLRRTIQAAAPGAVECINYGVPAFKLNGKLLVAFGAGANHCALYPGPHPIEIHKDELQTYSTSKGTIRFSADKPLPVALIRKLVKTRVAEHAVRKVKKASR